MSWLFIVYFAAVPVFLVAVNRVLNRFTTIHPHRTPFTAGFYTNLVFVPAYCGLHFALHIDSVLELVCGLGVTLIYMNCMVFLNWFVFTLTDVSMHIQLMMQLSRSGGATEAELVNRYNKSVILGNRVPRLLELGQLRLTDGRLFITGHSVLFGASVAALCRRLLGIPVRPELAAHE